MTYSRAPKSPQTRKGVALPRDYHTPTVTVPPEILVVEDGSDLFPKVGQMLQKGGFQVILAPDADTALQEMMNYNIVAVIAGASQNQFGGLDVLAAAKEKRAEVKTMVITGLVNPTLPIQAYEMEIDDYIHWPLSGPELTGRLRELLDPGEGRETSGLGMEDAGHDFTLTAVGSLVDSFSDSLALISQTLEDLRQEHFGGMPAGLSEELADIAAQVQKLSDNMQECWRMGPIEPNFSGTSRRYH